jgi:hypothetical protein
MAAVPSGPTLDSTPHYTQMKKEEKKVLYNRSDIVAEIKPRRIEWLGHVLRMENSRVLQNIVTRRRGTRDEINGF